jgi:hypothetical protein
LDCRNQGVNMYFQPSESQTSNDKSTGQNPLCRYLSATGANFSANFLSRPIFSMLVMATWNHLLAETTENFLLLR